MFGFSPTKLLVLAAIIAAVIYGPRLLRELDRVINGPGRSARGDGEKAPTVAQIETRECPICGDYVVPKSADNCGRDNCPYG